MHAVRLSRTAAAALRAVRTSPPALARAYAAPVEFKQPPVDPQLGDYPQLPAISSQWRKANDPWWDAQGRRNFEEPVPEQDEALTIWAADVYATSGPSALFQFSIACGVFTAFGFLLYYVKPERRSVPREYPYDGLREALGGAEENKATVMEEE